MAISSPVHRLLAIAVAGALAASSAHAAAVDCPTMRARDASHCCCPSGAADQARLVCCTDGAGARAAAANPQELPDRPHAAPAIAAVAHVLPRGGVEIPARAFLRALPAGAAGPPPVPLLI